MERDPFRFARHAAPGLNAGLVALLGLAGLPLLWLGLDLVAAAVDAVALRGAGDGDGTAPFLRYAIDLPARIREEPLVLFPGVPLRREALPGAIAAAALCLVVLSGLLAFAAERLRARIGRRVSAALLSRITDGVASAPLAAEEEARTAALLAGDAVSARGGVLGSAVAAPVLLVGTIALCGLYLGRLGLPLLLALLAGLTAYAVLGRRAARRGERLAAAEQNAGAALRRALVSLARNLPALASHGTAESERSRIRAELATLDGPVDALGRRAGLARAAALAGALLGPAGVLAGAAWAGGDGDVSPGSAAAAFTAALVALAALHRYLGWRRDLAAFGPVFSEVARTMGALQSRRQKRPAADLPGAGPLVAENLATPVRSGGRLNGATFRVALPTHLALLGGPSSGAPALAAVLGGQLAPSAGRLLIAGQDLPAADPALRARRFAFAGGETYLFAGRLDANLLYGCPDATDGSGRLEQAVEVAGLDGFVIARGFSGSIDPRREPALAEAVVEARRAVRTGLEARGLTELVEPFDPERYNSQATIGENLLFGVALGDTFREDRLPSQPFMRGLLDREGLAKPLAALGASLAESTLEMFSGLGSGSPLLRRFAPFPAGERGLFEEILERRGAKRRGTGSARDTERLIGVALRYSESRHRLGLLGPDLQARLVGLRRAFAEAVPDSLRPAVEFFEPGRVCAAASLRDNLLFGRIAQGRAEAEREVFGALRAILGEAGLLPEVFRIGLSTRVDPAAPGMSAAELASVDVVRGLVRGSDNLVIERALEPLTEDEAVALLRRLGPALEGRGLIAAVPVALEGALLPFFPQAIRFEAGHVAAEPRRPEVVGRQAGGLAR